MRRRINTWVFLAVTLSSCGSGSWLDADAEAIDLAKHVAGAERIASYPGHFEWQVVMWCTRARKCPRALDPESAKARPIRVVCFCDEAAGKPRGWYVEADLDAKSAQAISGNPRLRVVYGLP
jgi:hypothetical protein